MNFVRLGLFNNSKEMSRRLFFIVLFFSAFILWMFCFRGFLLNRLALTFDAISYYDHIKYFVDNISRGIYPLWDPAWNCGVANEFFLRRFGAYNPFFLLISLFTNLGFSYPQAYLLFLAAYYFIGMSGFYLLAKRVFADRAMAFTAALLLMFSALGTRLFDSYILLAFIPVVWFFYFLLAFGQRPQRWSFLGVTFALMIILTTYLPFYFLTIFGMFIVCYLFVYWKYLRGIISSTLGFLRKNKFFVFLCLLALGVSLLPGALFYRAAGKGDVVFPSRHYDYQQTSFLSDNQMEVDIVNITSWGWKKPRVLPLIFRICENSNSPSSMCRPSPLCSAVVGHALRRRAWRRSPADADMPRPAIISGLRHSRPSAELDLERRSSINFRLVDAA